MNVEIPDYGNIKDLIKRGENVAALDLVLKLREACVELREQLQEANDRFRALEEQVRLKAKVAFKNNVCWIEGDPQPICPVCWEHAAKVVHLNGPYHSDNDESYTCKVDDKTFYTRFAPIENVAMQSWDDFSSSRTPLF
jgi:hypothetical protein